MKPFDANGPVALIMRRSVRNLERPLLLGFLVGFFGAAPLAAAILTGLHWTDRLDLLPVPYAGETQMDSCDWIAVPALVSAVRRGSSLVVGSSEFGHQGGGDSVMDNVNRLWTSGPVPVSPGIRGSAVRKAILALERLETYGTRPRRLLVVINHHYLTSANEISPGSVATSLGGSESLVLHVTSPRTPMILRDRAFYSAETKKTSRPVAAVVSLGRCISLSLSPVDSLLRSTGQSAAATPLPPRWNEQFGIDETMMSQARPVPALAKQKAIPMNVAETAFGEDLRRLVEATRARGIALHILVLPLNQRYSRHLGLDPVVEQAAMFTQIQAMTTGMKGSLSLVHELQNDRLFFDSIHFYAEGRALLAQRIVQTLHSGE